jgi:hypothetical protein
VLLISFYYSHNICVITTMQLREDISSLDSIIDLFSSLIVCDAYAVNAGDDRVYLVGYIFYIIDCHIYQNIFNMIDIIY